MGHRRTDDHLRTAIDCLPRRTREAMLGAVGEEEIIVGAYSASGGGVCPMLGAHRRGGRTSFVSFAHAWDRFTAAPRHGSRPATPRELRVLERLLRASLAADEAGTATPLDPPTGGAMGAAIAEHRALASAAANRDADRRAELERAAEAALRAREREARAAEAAEAAALRAAEARLAAEAASPACEAVLRSAAAAARREAADAHRRAADRRAARLRRDAELVDAAPTARRASPRRRFVPLRDAGDVAAVLRGADPEVALGLGPDAADPVGPRTAARAGDAP